MVWRKSIIPAILRNCTLLWFVVFLMFWIGKYHRFFVLYHHEQMQLFRFDRFYAASCLSKPGGLSEYLGSFFTQFYYFPIIGTLEIILATVAVLLLFRFACKRAGNADNLFFIFFIPAVLLSMSFVDIHFRMSFVSGILIALSAFGWYVALKPPLRYYAGWIAVPAVYFAAGGNVWLLLSLISVHELLKPGGSGKLYPVFLVLCAALISYLSWLFVYDVTLREACFALTPVNFRFPTAGNTALWLSFPVLYAACTATARKTDRRKAATWKTAVVSCVSVIVLTAAATRLTYDKRSEILGRMTREVQHGNWEQALELGMGYPTKNRLICYLTNIALYETGQMPHRMFHVRQLGPAGLFLDRDMTYPTLWHLGEVYYRLGMIPEAEHCAFEALVTSPDEPNAQALQRLATTCLIRRDTALFRKYAALFDHAPMYGKWIRQQRLYLNSSLADPSFRIPGAPAVCRCADFFIDYRYPAAILQQLLRSCPEHRMAFEYLMAFHLLYKDIAGAKECMDAYYAGFSYPSIPVHYEEALLIYENTAGTDSDFAAQYPVSPATRRRFDEYIQAFKAAQGSRRNYEHLEKKFANTYWFYVHFTEPVLMRNEDEKNRY
ncbi:MAG: DUF6057 family protein [Bacteroidales bacterium]|jgi:tetratricopeptide (TPR) repeat protein|nr:DUF6057 family protein [Bacteroidales bacterium]